MKYNGKHICIGCGVEFTDFKHKDRKYCERKCSMRDKRRSMWEGKKYGRLTCLGIETENWRAYGLFRCDCGNVVKKSLNHVVSGRTTSCGCYHTEMMCLKNLTHGMTKSKEFNIWQHMIARCYNKNNPAYKDYGGRGITICERWLNKFENFYEDMGMHY